jgi:hypothetical protein
MSIFYSSVLGNLATSVTGPYSGALQKLGHLDLRTLKLRTRKLGHLDLRTIFAQTFFLHIKQVMNKKK